MRYRNFNGEEIPFGDHSQDICMFIDVLHHTSNLEVLLKEAFRVSRKYILIKDHIYITKLDYLTLKFMDWFGNHYLDVPLVYNFKNKELWNHLFALHNLKVVKFYDSLDGLYHPPFGYIFGRKLNFIALLKKCPN